MSNDSENFDLKSLVDWCWKGRYWLLVSTLLVTAAFVLTAFLTQPIYRATTLLVATEQDGGGLSGRMGSTLGSLGGLASLAGIEVGRERTQSDVALAVLQSRQFIQSFVEENSLLPILYAKHWNPATGTWLGGREPPTLARANRELRKKILHVEQDRRTGLVQVSVDWKDPVLAAAWSNGLILKLNREMRDRAIERTTRSVEYLKGELEQTSTIDTRTAINQLLAEQVSKRMLANVTPDYAFRVVDQAMAPETTEMLRPNRPLLVVLGPIAGIICGVLLLILRDAIPRKRGG